MRITSCLFALLFVAACGSAAERHQGAVIRSGPEGQPCFAVEDNAETRRSVPRIAAVELYERRDGAAVLLWRSDFVPEQGGVEKRLPIDDCISYPAENVADLPLLEVGKPYGATIWAFIDLDGEIHRRWYSGRFCIFEVDGRRQVYQLSRGEKLDASGREVCGVDALGVRDRTH